MTHPCFHARGGFLSSSKGSFCGVTAKVAISLKGYYSYLQVFPKTEMAHQPPKP